MSVHERFHAARTLIEALDPAAIAASTVRALLFAYPILLLSVRNGMSVCNILLLIASLVWLLDNTSPKIRLNKGDIAFAVAMASLFFVTILNLFYHGVFRLSEIDGPSRFLFAIPIYLALRTMPISIFQPLQYSFPIGIVTGLLTTLFLHGPHSFFHGTYFLDAPMWGGAMIALSFLSAPTIKQASTGKRDHLVLLLKIGIALIGLYGAVMTDERGGWIAIIVAFCLWAHYRFPLRYRLMIGALATALVLGAFYLIPSVPQRVALTGSEIHKIVNGDLDTSIGKRLQIWRGAVEALRRHPFAGVGPEGVHSELRKLDARGWFTAEGLQAGLSQIHSEIVANTFRLGLFGLAAILSIYFAPLFLFATAMETKEAERSAAAFGGMLFVVTYLVLGFSNENFNLKMLASFYAVTVAVLLAHVFSLDGGAVNQTQNDGTQEV